MEKTCHDEGVLVEAEKASKEVYRAELSELNLDEGQRDDFTNALMGLTEKQYNFVLGIVEGKTQREAYRQAYNTDKQSTAVLDINATRLMNHDKISEVLLTLRFNGILAKMDDREGHIRRMEGLSHKAEFAENWGAAVQAHKNSGAAQGFYEVKHVIDISEERKTQMQVIDDLVNSKRLPE